MATKMNRFAATARKRTSISPLLANREKVETEYLIDTYPDGFTVVGFDLISTGSDTFPVIVFAEDDTKFYFGGKVLSEICEDWAALYDGDIETASDDLRKDGGVKMRLRKTSTKNGRDVVVPEIL